MELLDALTIPHPAGDKVIEAYQGDLTALGPKEAADILVVSASPDNYSPEPGTLIGALERKGVSLWRLAQDKAFDLRATHSCWLSGLVTTSVPEIRFRRILCFEPRVRGYPPEVVGDIFRALAPFLGDDPPGTTVAMPLVACGNQAVPVAEMVVPLLDAAVNWMSRDFPLRRLMVVEYSDARAAQFKAIFAKATTRPTRRSGWGIIEVARELPRAIRGWWGGLWSAATGGSSRSPAGPVSPGREPARAGHDVFVSYAHADAVKAGAAVAELRALYPSARVFYDRLSIRPGMAWQQEIYEAIEDCRHFVPFYSPAYLGSKVCLEEFHLAKFCSRETGSAAIFPIYLYSAPLPAYMRMLHYADCREGNEAQLREACRELLARLSAPAGNA